MVIKHLLRTGSVLTDLEELPHLRKVGDLNELEDAVKLLGVLLLHH